MAGSFVKPAILVALLLGLSLQPVWADDGDVVRETLPNGLRIVIVRDRLAPVIATSVNYLVGSEETPKGFPGTAHALEHMMFRGSPGLSAEQLADIGSIMGGRFNADTRESVTQYIFTVPSEDLDIALNIEAARMRGLDASDAEWKNERGAIEQEVAQDLSNPTYVLVSKLRAALFAGTPYEHDALGTRPSFDKTTAAALKRFYEQWYAPNNAVMIIAGDLDPKPTLKEISDLFGSIPKHALPKRPEFSLKPVKPVSISLDTDQEIGTEMIALRIPGLDSPDFPALEVLADVLSSQRGDLYGLVAAGKAVQAEFGLEPLPKAGLGYAVVEFPTGADPKAIENDMRGILKKIAREGVPPDLVEAAKLQERREAEFEKNSIEGLASVWAEAIAVYGLNEPDDDLRRIERVTVEDVNRAARKYLDLDHAVSAVMVPRGSGRPVAARGGFGGQETIALGEASNVKLPDWAQATLERLSVPESTLHPDVSTLPNGLTLIVQPETVSNTVTILGHVKSRPEVEAPAGKEGVAQVLDQLFPYGTKTLDRLALQQALDAIGAQEMAGPDFAIEVLAKDFDRGAMLLADHELNPALPEKAFALVRDRAAQVVAARNASPGHLAQHALHDALFPATDPTLREATPQTIRALGLDDVRAYYKLAYRPDLSTIVVMGKTTPEAARAIIEKYFGGWSATGPAPTTDLPPVPPNGSKTVAVPDASRVQDEVTMAEVMGLKRSDSDYYALELGNAVLGGGFYSTRLSIDLRKNAGLVYSVGSQLVAGTTRSAYFVSFACDPQNVGKSADLIVRELKTMQSSEVSAPELNRVKEMLTRRIPLSEASVMGIAHGFIQRRDLNLPLNEPTIEARRVIALGAADVQAAFQKWIRPEDLVRISQGPEPR